MHGPQITVAHVTICKRPLGLLVGDHISVRFATDWRRL
jgi:hypothetical protein